MNAGRIRAGLAGALAVALIVFSPPETSAQPAVKRYIIAVGSNSGGKSRPRLKYAVSDAQAVCRLFEDLGGVSREDVLLLPDPDTGAFYTELGRLQERLARSRREFSRTELFFYFSGHSDEEHLLLGEEKISYRNLRRAVELIPADMRVVILDSCASGLFIRSKGGKKRPPFLLDEAFHMTGQAFLTSSSATEASQESDLIKASYFTHYLLSGLRGAADMSLDRRVTLNEAYQFAFQETLAETTRSGAGPQHPNYSIDMAGTGDVVMTDLRQSDSLLVLSKDLAGKLFILDRNGRLAVELTKPGGQDVTLALEPGDYRLVQVPEDKVFECRVALRRDSLVMLGSKDFLRTETPFTTTRGDRTRRLAEEYRRVERGFEGRPIIDLAGMPTGFTLAGREMIVGLGNVELGLSDRLQVGTNVLLYLFQVFNGQAKYRLWSSETTSLAAGIDLGFMNLKGEEERLGFTSASPFLAVSQKVSDRVALHFAGRYSRFSGVGELKEIESLWLLQGTSLFAGLDYSVSRQMKILAEGGFDATFQGPRFAAAVLFGWERFQLKLGISVFKLLDLPALAVPVIGLWWRFRV